MPQLAIEIVRKAGNLHAIAKLNVEQTKMSSSIVQNDFYWVILGDSG